MKRYIIAILALLLISEKTRSQAISSKNLLNDFMILKAVLLNYHPGLYRFQDSVTVAGIFDNLEQQLNRVLSLSEAYLVFSGFTAKIRCGHTFCSFYNQNGQTKDSLFNKSDKVPFTFFLFDKGMFILNSVSWRPIPS